MGHREDLLTAARRLLEEKGYARTTARDLVAASGTNLASIGYHFGSKEALLNEAIGEAVAEWTDQVGAMSMEGREARGVARRRARADRGRGRGLTAMIASTGDAAVRAQSCVYARRRPAEGARSAGRGPRRRRALPDPAGRDRLGQDCHDGVRD